LGAIGCKKSGLPKLPHNFSACFRPSQPQAIEPE